MVKIELSGAKKSVLFGWSLYLYIFENAWLESALYRPISYLIFMEE